MKDYLNLVERVLTTGDRQADRTGTGTLSVFGGSVSFDLRERFPVLQHKETRWRTAFIEMLWFLTGHATTEWLHKHGVRLWDDWAKWDGSTGPIYGVQWRRWMTWAAQPEVRNFDTVDQIKRVIAGLRDNPSSRRLMVSAWHAAELDDMCLPPCHFAHQLRRMGNSLHMVVYQRSWDLGLGAPFNIAQYALLLTLYARTAGLTPCTLTFCYGDAHIYLNHVDAMREMLARDVTQDQARLVIHTNNTDIDGYKPDDFEIVGYQPQPFISLKVSV